MKNVEKFVFHVKQKFQDIPLPPQKKIQVNILFQSVRKLSLLSPLICHKFGLKDGTCVSWRLCRFGNKMKNFLTGT
jgi:hypothetical protein